MKKATEILWIDKESKKGLFERKRMDQTYSDVIKDLLNNSESSMKKNKKQFGDMFGK